MNDLISFFSFQNSNTTFVLIGTILLSSSSGLIGCFAYLRKRSLAGDVIAHAVLPGITIAFMLTGIKDPLILLIGAFATGLLSLLAIEFIVNNSKLKADTANGLVLSVFFGIGIMLMSILQNTGDANQSGLDKFIFGSAASLIEKDVWVFGSVAAILITITISFYKYFKIISFDRNYAIALGLNVKLFENLLTIMTVLAVVIGIQAVGVVLMAAMLITPAAAARFWSNKLHFMIYLALFFSLISSISGTFISYLYPGMATGPWIVLFLSLMAFTSFIFAPTKGVIAKLRQQRKNRFKILEENILKTLYQLIEKDNSSHDSDWTIQDILKRKKFEPSQLNTGLKRLIKQGFIRYNKINQSYSLKLIGFTKGKRITKNHRLWEMYLTEFLSIAPDHVHDDSEIMEHLITPEIEKQLEAKLGFPKKDPHNKEIPY